MRRTIGVAFAAACLLSLVVIACVGSDPDPIAPTPDAARNGDDDDGVVPGRDSGPDASTPPLGCVIGGEIFDFCDSFDGPSASFVPPWDAIDVTDAGHLQRVDGGALGVLDEERVEGGAYHPSAAATLKAFVGDIGVFVLERRMRVTPTDESAEQTKDPGIILSQVVFKQAAGGADAQFIFYHTWVHPTHDGGTFDGATFGDAYAGLGLTLGGGQRSDPWAKLPRVGQWYLVRDTYELTDNKVTWTVVVDGEQQLHTERSMAFPHMRDATLFNGPAVLLTPGVPAHAGWVVDIDDVRVGIKPRL
jgi:hypothetical protein